MTDENAEAGFPGVGEQLKDGRIRVYLRHPEWKEDPRAFAELYDEVRSIIVPQSGPAPKPQWIGVESPRRCAFCGHDDEEVSFAKEAHVVPAGLGNRHVFSFEECDDCNAAFGESLDQELVNFLSVERVLAGVRKRGVASIKQKAPDSTSFEYSQRSQRLEFVTDSSLESPMIRMTERTATSFDIQVYRSAYRKDEAIRNIVRLAWMCLAPEHRGASRHYLDLIQGTTLPEPWHIFRLFIPAAPKQVAFRVWRAASRTDIPQTVAMLTVGHIGLIWISSEEPTAPCRPGPLPSFECDPQFGDPLLRMETIQPGHRTPAQAETIRFGHNGLTEGSIDVLPASRPAPHKPKVQSQPAELRWTDQDREHRLSTSIEIQRNDGNVFRCRLGAVNSLAILSHTRRLGRYI